MSLTSMGNLVYSLLKTTARAADAPASAHHSSYPQFLISRPRSLLRLAGPRHLRAHQAQSSSYGS
jgi:hypothetical protein